MENTEKKSHDLLSKEQLEAIKVANSIFFFVNYLLTEYEKLESCNNWNKIDYYYNILTKQITVFESKIQKIDVLKQVENHKKIIEGVNKCRLLLWQIYELRNTF